MDLSNAITHLKSVVRSVDVSALDAAAAKSAIVDAYIAAAENALSTPLPVGMSLRVQRKHSVPEPTADGFVDFDTLGLHDV